MTIEHDDLQSFKNAYLDYLEGDRDRPPALDSLPEDQHRAAKTFIASITASRGVDPYASRPSIEQLLALRSSTHHHTLGFGNMLQDHLRRTVDPRASVIPDAASDAVGLASVYVVRVRGMRIRIVPETHLPDLQSGITARADDIAEVFKAFPDSHAVLYTTSGEQCRGVVVDRGDIGIAIETPSGERRPPRLQRSIANAAKACEEWLTSMIPLFEPVSIGLLEAGVAPESALDAFEFASAVVREVSTAGDRARIEAKRATWRHFGVEEARCLADIVQEAQSGQLSEEAYKSRLNELVGIAA